MQVVGKILGVLIVLGLVAYCGFSIYKLVLEIKKKKKIKEDTNKIDKDN